MCTGAVTRDWQCGNHAVNELFDLAVVLVEHADDFVVGDRLTALNPGIHVCDERDVDIADLELAREVGLGGHAGADAGRVGSSGLLNAPGLYFELRYKGKPIDPAQWLQRR